jgi:hypothetical protein
MVFYFVNKQLLSFNLKTVLLVVGALIKVIANFKEYLEVITEIPDLFKLLDSIRVPSSQHALPQRTAQPGRNVELNLAIYNGIAGQPGNRVIQGLRERLWTEHLGLVDLPADLKDVPADPAQMKWVEFWDRRAEANQEAFKKEQKLPNNETTHILKWMPQSDAELYLRDLDIRTVNLRSSARKYSFSDCKVEQETLFPWPLL